MQLDYPDILGTFAANHLGMETLDRISALKEQLDPLRPFDPDREAAIMQKLRLDWNYHSNHLEGNTLTYGETKALILFGLTAQGKPLKDHVEMTGHNEAILWIEEVVREERPLTENFIRQLHTLLLKAPYEVDAIAPDGKPSKKRIHIGEYKKTPNHVLTPTGEIFRFATPEETPAKMKDLIEWFRERKAAGDLHPLLLAAEFHYRFVRIHPFDDGNGRVARMLMNFILMQHGYPPVVIKTEDKQNYFLALQQADAGLLEPFIEYIGQNLVRSMEIMIKGAKGEPIADPDDVDKEIALLEKRLKGLEQKPSKFRSKEVVLELYDLCLSSLAELFVQECQKLGKFYQNTSVVFRYGDTYNKFNISNFKMNIRKVLEKQRDVFLSLRIVYEFNHFDSTGIRPFDYYSELSVLLEGEYYELWDKKKGVGYKKWYHQYLTEEEKHKLVKAEIDHHLVTIEEKIKEAEKKENS